MPSSSVAVACGTGDWKENLAAEFKMLNALHLELQQRPHDPALVQAYEAYKKRREEEREAYKMKFYPSQLQNFGNTSLPKETKSVRGQSCPADDSTSEFTTPTFEELPKEYHQAYEVLKKKRAEEFEVLKKKLEEENMQEFHAKLEKDLQYVKSLPPCNNNVEPSTTTRQE